MKTFIYLSLFSLLVFSAACSGSETKLVASGAFEATEVIVSSESTGKILELSLEEGQEVAAGQVVGRIECLPLNPQNLDLQIKRCQVAAPVGGTVMVKYAQLGEFAATGKALFKLADTRNMLLRAYISADQLTHMQLGQAVKVQADFGAEGFRQYPGTKS